MWIDQRGSQVLPRTECLRLLAMSAAAGRVGRLAVSTGTAPLVHPVNFGFFRGDVVVRVGDGTAWRAAPGHLVAFEVDDVSSGPAVGSSEQATVGWSVLVRGLATVVTMAPDVDAAHLPHPFVPSPGDHLLAIRPDVVSGRLFPVDHDETVARRGAPHGRRRCEVTRSTPT